MKKRKLNIKRLIALSAALSVTLIPSAYQRVDAEPPSLFHDDEAWYKDSVSPLVIRDGIRYVPSDIFNMLDMINVEIYNGNNLLIENTSSGQYVSILFLERTAVINDVIHEDIDIFRDNGVYYVDAATVAEAVGVSIEEYALSDASSGEIGLRLYDSSAKLTVEQLLAPYVDGNSDDSRTDGSSEFDYGFDDSYNSNTPESGGVESGIKKIYVLSREPSAGEYFTAKKSLDDAGIEYTLFVDGTESVGEIIGLCAAGEYGIDSGLSDISGAAERADKINAGFYELSGRMTHLTLATGDDTADGSLISAGYRVISPDFTVNVGNDAYTVLEGIKAYLSDNSDRENNYCTLMLTDCWQTTKMVELLSELDRTEYLVCGYRADGKDW